MKDEKRLWQDFEEKFGFKTFEELKKIIGTYYEKLKTTKESREMWRQKANTLEQEIKILKLNIRKLKNENNQK